MGFENKVAVVTGAASGIGKATAEALAEAGAMVVCADIDREKGEAAAATIRSKGQKAQFLAVDLTDEASIRAFADTVQGELGAVDILVNGAGWGRTQPFWENPPELWEKLVSLNFVGPMRLVKALLPKMLERGSGKIVNVCSLMSELARETIAPYTAAKGALKMLTRSMCAEWARHGIQANGLAPGWFRTDLTVPLQADPAFDAWLRGRVPAGRWGEPDELGGAVVFLASAASDFVNGQVLVVDGGLSAVV